MGTLRQLKLIVHKPWFVGNLEREKGRRIFLRFQRVQLPFLLKTLYHTKVGTGCLKRILRGCGSFFLSLLFKNLQNSNKCLSLNFQLTPQKCLDGCFSQRFRVCSHFQGIHEYTRILQAILLVTPVKCLFHNLHKNQNYVENENVSRTLSFLE